MTDGTRQIADAQDLMHIWYSQEEQKCQCGWSGASEGPGAVPCTSMSNLEAEMEANEHI